MRGFFAEDVSSRPALADFLRWFYRDRPRETWNLEEILAFLSLGASRLSRWGMEPPHPIPPPANVYADAIEYLRHRLQVPLAVGVCDLHMRLLATLQDSDSIISLNYDLVMDRALAALQETSKKADGGRLGKVAVLVTDLGYLGQSPIAATSFEGGAGYYLKLHGSLGWVTCATPSCLNANRFHEIDVRTEVINGHHGQPCRYCGCALQLVVVPPVSNKHIEERGKLAVLWVLALRELIRASHLAVVGLSLAPSDFELRWLLKQAIQLRGDTKLTVALVNPSVQDRHAFEEWLAGPSVTVAHFDNVAHYIASVEA